jgi:hypothetical protein
VCQTAKWMTTSGQDPWMTRMTRIKPPPVLSSPPPFLPFSVSLFTGAFLSVRSLPPVLLFLPSRLSSTSLKPPPSSPSGPLFYFLSNHSHSLGIIEPILRIPSLFFGSITFICNILSTKHGSSSCPPPASDGNLTSYPRFRIRNNTPFYQYFFLYF